MEFKGTKGKWMVVQDDDYHAVVLTESGFSFGRTYIAREIAQGHDEGKYDALLISKAPEILDMLKSIVDYGGIANWDNIKQLIKEATEL